MKHQLAYDTPVNEDIINNFRVLVDLIYNPMETEFLKIGKKLNRTVIRGLDMLIFQGCKIRRDMELYKN